MKHPRVFTPSPRAFTLIELLVVIAIIAILAGLMFPAIGTVLDQAKRTNAKNDAVQIANAVTMYETEYGKFPPESSTVSGDLVTALLGTANNTNNPRQIVFLEAGNWKKGKGGISSDGSYNDPWNHPYKIAMDTGYSNSVSAQTLVGGALVTTNYRKRVVVWNEGTGDSGGAANKRYFVNSAD